MTNVEFLFDKPGEFVDIQSIAWFLEQWMQMDEINLILIKQDIFEDDYTPAERYIDAGYFNIYPAVVNAMGVLEKRKLFVSAKGAALLLDAARYYE